MRYVRLIGKFAAPLLVGIALVYGGWNTGYDAGYRASLQRFTSNGSSEAGETNADFSPFWEAWRVLEDKYIDPDKVDDQQKVWGAIEGLASAYGDPYTVFFPPVESKEFQNEISGSFEGVGMELGIKDGTLTVVAPLKGSPAEKAGMKAGDKILSIDGKPSATLPVDQAVKLIRGPKGTEVKLTISRAGKKSTFEVKIVRDVINIPTIDTEMPDGSAKDIFVIRLYNFSAISPEMFRGALREFILSGRNKLILDLRGNPGGYLEASVDMASWFLPAGKTIVTEKFGEGSREIAHRSRGYDVFNNNLKFAILMDGGSASAAEILAGALQDHGVAKLVGSKTFGKGSVQELVDITPETSLKVTVAKWLTPKGRSISDGGLTPDIEIKAGENDSIGGPDAQFEAAVKLLTE